MTTSCSFSLIREFYDSVYILQNYVMNLVKVFVGMITSVDINEHVLTLKAQAG